jgi:hypothetical protein
MCTEQLPTAQPVSDPRFVANGVLWAGASAFQRRCRRRGSVARVLRIREGAEVSDGQSGCLGLVWAATQFSVREDHLAAARLLIRSVLVLVLAGGEWRGTVGCFG